MYKEHPIFIPPVNPDIKLWRYIDFTKLVSLLSREQLFFSRADKFADPFEGSASTVNKNTGLSYILKE